MFFRNFIEPWIIKEIETGNLKSGEEWGVKIIAQPGNVIISGVINGNKGKLSDSKFAPVSIKATNAVKGMTFPTFETWLSKPQVYTE
jgi:hypothetical protein